MRSRDVYNAPPLPPRLELVKAGDIGSDSVYIHARMLIYVCIRRENRSFMSRLVLGRVIWPVTSVGNNYMYMYIY